MNYSQSKPVPFIRHSIQHFKDPSAYNKTKMYRLLFGLCTILILLSCPLNLSYSQWISTPLPSSIGTKQNNCCSNLTFKNVNPSVENLTKIQILTKELYEGKNLVNLKITSYYPIISKELRYTVGEDTKSAYLAKQLGNEFKALINVKQPESVLSVIAIDNESNVFLKNQTLKVNKSDQWYEPIKKIMDLFK